MSLVLELVRVVERVARPGAATVARAQCQMTVGQVVAGAAIAAMAMR